MKNSYPIAILSLAALMFSCQPGQEDSKVHKAAPEYKDGIYSASYSTPDSRGWKGFLEVQVRDKVIVSANFDYINPEGKLKSQDQAYADNMKKVSGVTPSDAARALLDSLVDVQTEEVAVVTGATSTTAIFKALAKVALAKAIAGDPTPSLIPQSE